MRLFYFDMTQGNKIALQCLAEELGWKETIGLALKLQYRLITDNPFKEINRHKPPSKQEKLTQRQMGPMVVLYHLLEESHPRARCLQILSELSQRVAIAFLKFNVPVIEAKQYKNLPRKDKLAMLKKITQRFFNAKAELKLDSQDNFKFNVSVCYFARYAKMLNVPELAPLFCASDKIYFDNHQPDVRLIRTVTLATDNKPCDFYFQWKDSDPPKTPAKEEEDATMRTVF
ncbi:MAG: L-2-amino-thiazoline-4-carboxylic acid hydrolase [Pseudomonadales bacterium]|nr:L-2-amino-thiazoline-4-carboxylic acid hydrolase [Pseudomonadales bacterium]